ncbi:MAG: AAA family ATPase, partial [Euryarchaeota archaeon]|nr:AAA family ATPase [Euryarchaeota archaeon]
MHIKEIELRNFKSFGRKVSIPLENDFIAITGPNGSGKSNIIDALLFALCLSSSRVMRAERLPDLIYKGENGKNPDFAQVTVRFDNSCRTMPVDEDVVEISRKVKLTKDRYHSVYSFNGDTCSLSELHDILSRSGITPEGYNVVMQGDVTRIIEMNPTDRRKIIDEIAGVADFDEKKRKALGELEVVRERIDRLDVILDEVSAQRLKLGEERDRAITYQAHRDEKRHQEAFLLLAKLREAEAEQASLEKETEDLLAQDELFRERYRAKKDALASLEDELKRLSSDIAHKGEDEQLEVKRKIEELKGEIEREESRIEMADREISETEVERRRIYLEMDRLSEEADALTTKIRDAGIREASLVAELEEESERLEAVRSEIAEADVEYAQLRDEMAVVKRKREEVKIEMADLMRDRDRYLDAARRRSSDQEDICSQISEYEETIRRSEREAERIKREIDQLEERGRELERNGDDLGFAMIGVRRELAEADQRLQELQVEKAKAEASLRSAREGPGYSRGVEVVRTALQKGQLEGLHGTIAELGRADNSYATALEVAAGARLQSIVAQTDEDASQAIAYLKRVRGGRVTFLPLNKMKTGRVPPDPPSLPGVVDYALNLVQFDGEFLPAFWHVFRDTLVVEDLTSARQLMGRYRMVTLGGDLVEK